MSQKQSKIEELVKTKCEEGRISCKVAHQIADQLDVSLGSVGQVINKLDIKIYGCQLGCF